MILYLSLRKCTQLSLKSPDKRIFPQRGLVFHKTHHKSQWFDFPFFLFLFLFPRISTLIQ